MLFLLGFSIYWRQMWCENPGIAELVSKPHGMDKPLTLFVLIYKTQDSHKLHILLTGNFVIQRFCSYDEKY